MATALAPITNPVAPSLPLGTEQYQRQYQDQLNNVLRLYFNQLGTALNAQVTNNEFLQSEIDALIIETASLQSQIDALVDEARPQTLIWLGM